MGFLSANWGDADVLAGGTDLISCMKDNLHTPKRVVNIDELANNADIKAGAKALSDAAAGIPSPQIRHMGTVGGDLCQRPRCWYYRQGMGLLGTKDGKSLIPTG